MADAMIADRYWRVEVRRWIDLVTGRRVTGRQHVGVVDRQVLERCREAHAVWRDGVSRLIDYGAPSLSDWFEVWSEPAKRVAPLFALRHIHRNAIDAIVEHALAHRGAGPRVLTLTTCHGAGTQSMLSEAARALRDLGFVTIRADIVVPRTIRHAVCHRHVVLIDADPTGRRGAAAAWVDDLVRVSNRSHLVLTVAECHAGARAPVIHLEPCTSDELIEAFVPGTWRPSAATIASAAAESDGWPGRFVRALEHDCGSAAIAAMPSRALSVSRGSVVHDAPLDVAQPLTIVPADGRGRSTSVEYDGRGRVELPHPSRRRGHSAGELLQRATGLARRGRHAAAAEWYAAALAAARRWREDDGVVAAFAGVTDRLRRTGKIETVAARAEVIARDLRSTSSRVALVEVAASACLRAGDVRRADALLAQADAERALAATRDSCNMLACQNNTAPRAELRFWQGRFTEGLAEIDEQPRSPALVRDVWRALLAWGARDRRALESSLASLASRVASPGDVDNRMWTAAAIALGKSLLNDQPAAMAGLRTLGRVSAESGSTDWQALARAVSSMIGGPTDRNRIDARRDRGARVDSVFSVLERWMRRDAGGGAADAGKCREIDRVVRRLGLDGFRRWERGRRNMVVLDDVAALLQMTHDAEDEDRALTRACDWARTAAQASSVGIFAAGDARHLGGDRTAIANLDPLDLTRHVQPNVAITSANGLARALAPVRYGGVTIALVIARGVAEREAQLAETAQAVGSVCAPLIRARLDACGTADGADALAGQILGISPAMSAVRAAAARAAMTPFSVLIEGESGTGKELVARALHRLGPRRDRRFCGLNCAALTDELFESELFGHARGAFTGAVTMRVGLFEEAHQGSLFLDEVADLSARAQAKLLRVLQEGEIRRVGENATRAVDVRVIAATNRPLGAPVNMAFREDLLFRLAVIRIVIPPLRDRVEDVPMLVHALWRDASRAAGSRALVGADAIAALCRHHWPGNVRQLQNILAALAVHAPARGRVMARHVEDVIGVHTGTSATSVSLEVARRSAERAAVSAALARHAGSRQAAARSLGLSRQGLTKAIRRLGLNDPHDSAGAA